MRDYILKGELLNTVTFESSYFGTWRFKDQEIFFQRLKNRTWVFQTAAMPPMEFGYQQWDVVNY
jgi:hypothetical protein